MSTMTKFLTALIGGILIPAAFLVGGLFLYVAHLGVERAHEAHVHALIHAADAIEAFLDVRERELLAIASEVSVQGAIAHVEDAGAVADALRDIVLLARTSGAYERLLLVGIDGRVIGRVDAVGTYTQATSGAQSEAGADVPDVREALRVAPGIAQLMGTTLKRERDGSLVNLGTGGVPQYVPLIRYGVGVYRRGLGSGAIVADVRATELFDAVRALPGEQMLADRAGAYLVHEASPVREWGSEFGFHYSFFEDMPAVAAKAYSADAPRAGAVQAQDQAPSTAYARIGLTTRQQRAALAVGTERTHAPYWVIAEHITFVAAPRFPRELLLALVLPVPFVVIAVVLLTWMLRRRLAPLVALRAGMVRVADGDLLHELPGERDDALGGLVTAYNRMLTSVRTREEHIVGDLQVKVAKVEEQQRLLTEQRQALLNVLDDVEQEKRRAEALVSELERFRRAADSVQEGIVITDPNGIVLYANPAMATLTGYALSEIVDVKAGARYGGHMSKEFYQEFWHTKKVLKQPHLCTLRNRRKDGTFYDVQLMSAPILDRAGNVQFFVAVERDITREREIDRAKTEFISIASHELRTPLTGIKWFVDLLRREQAGSLTAEQKDYLHEIAQSDDRMIRLVSDLLDVSRIEGETDGVPHRESVALHTLIAEVVGSLAPLAAEREVTLRGPVDVPENLVLLVDAMKVRQVFRNLLDNAVKYTDPGTTVSVGRRGQRDGQDVFFVEDEGWGIPVGQQHRIFERFFRAENVHARAIPGTGLGLYIARAHVEAHGGTLWFTSTEGKGTTFFFTLPQEQAHPADPQDAAASTTVEQSQPGVTPPQRTQRRRKAS